VAARIQPVGKVEFGAAGGVAGAAKSGEEIVKEVCGACHVAGSRQRSKARDKAAWAPRLKQGLDGLMQSVLKGKGCDAAARGQQLSDEN
jgi:cytochrome c5